MNVEQNAVPEGPDKNVVSSPCSVIRSRDTEFGQG